MSIHKLSHKNRIKSKAHFKAVFNDSRKIDCEYFVLFIAKKKFEKGKIGFIVSKKVGKAVQRNNVKRKLKALMKLIDNKQLGSSDIIVLAKQKINTVTYAMLADSLDSKLKMINKDHG